MSDSVPEDRAGQYVLGVLDAAEMDDVRRDALRDAELAAAIAAWEERLAPLAVLAGDTVPPASLWEGIEARLDGRLPAPVVALPRRDGGRRGWRAVAIGAMALAAGLAGFLAWRTQLQPSPPRLAMILPMQPNPGGWLVELRPDGTIRAVAQGQVNHPGGRDFELWALAAGASAPVPLGLLPVAAGRADLHPASLPRTAFKLLVSLEPKGGSPTGLPTGPVMFAGAVLEPPT